MSTTRRLFIAKSTDSPAMREAIEWLNGAGIRFVRKTEWHLKIGPINFYPDKGTINRDGDRYPQRVRGLSGLQQLLRPPAVPTTPATPDRNDDPDEMRVEFE